MVFKIRIFRLLTPNISIIMKYNKMYYFFRHPVRVKFNTMDQALDWFSCFIEFPLREKGLYN